MTAALEVEDLTKSFGETLALAGVSLSVSPGQILGLLGPNGAGKTTLVRIMSTLERPDTGRARVYGLDVVRDSHRVRSLIGLTGQYAAVDEDLSGRNNLEIIARLLGQPARTARARADELLERFDLTQAGRRRLRGYSGGMRRRLDLAASLVGQPVVLYLDEPTTGLDPHSRVALWDTVRQMVSDGTTVLLTTQYMDEAERLADRLVVLEHGRVTAEGTTAALCSRVRGRMLRIRPTQAADLAAIASALATAGLDGGTLEQNSTMFCLPISSDAQLTAAVGALATGRIPLSAIDTDAPSLDEAFRSITRADAGPAAAPTEEA